ncbi:MAG: hypothetical protein ABSB19_00490 [Methylomonas sp.]|jgi:hypothetical protein
MSDCCPKPADKTLQKCPQCGDVCKPVGIRTLYHQVKFPDNQAIGNAAYFFCPAPLCPIGYFSETGNTIRKQDLRIWPEIQRGMLCYCFDIDAEHFLSAAKTGDAISIKEFVRQHTQSGDCACEIKNPSGLCCLAKFKHFE